MGVFIGVLVIEGDIVDVLETVVEADIVFVVLVVGLGIFEGLRVSDPVVVFETGPDFVIVVVEVPLFVDDVDPVSVTEDVCVLLGAGDLVDELVSVDPGVDDDELVGLIDGLGKPEFVVVIVSVIVGFTVLLIVVVVVAVFEFVEEADALGLDDGVIV